MVQYIIKYNTYNKYCHVNKLIFRNCYLFIYFVTCQQPIRPCTPQEVISQPKLDAVISLAHLFLVKIYQQ